MKNLIIGLLIVVALYSVGPPVVTMAIGLVATGTIIGTLLPLAFGIAIIGAIIWGIW